MSIPGGRPPSTQEVARLQDRLTFVYLQHATVSREANAVTATDARGTVHIPAALISCLMLGPGTRVTHQAMSLLGEAGASVVWVGESGVRYYAGGEPLARSSRLLISQAKLVSNEKTRIAVARQMYAMRFPDEDVSTDSMQQLRGKEGARVRKAYRSIAKRSGVEWSKREYTPGDFEAGSPINQALTAAHTALYGVVHAVVVALGASPGLGFVHTGNSRSFIYDLADLYKTKTSIPVAFNVIKEGYDDVSSAVRHAMRDTFIREKTLEAVVRDMKSLLLQGDGFSEEDQLADVVFLWDPLAKVVSGTNYDGGPGDLSW